MSDFQLYLDILQHAINNQTNENSLVWLENIAISTIAIYFFRKSCFNVLIVDINKFVLKLSTVTHDLPITTIVDVIYEAMQQVLMTRFKMGKEIFRKYFSIFNEI